MRIPDKNKVLGKNVHIIFFSNLAPHLLTIARLVVFIELKENLYAQPSELCLL